MKVFKELWERLYRPGNMCPDVELAFIEETLCDIIAKYDNSDLTYDAKWTKALIMLNPKSMSYIRGCWEYSIVDWYDSSFEETEAQLSEAKGRAEKSVKALIEAKEIKLVDDKYVSTNHSYQ